MTPKRLSGAIDRVLSAIEEGILHASDNEILRETKAARQKADQVRGLIERQVRIRTRTIPREAAARRRLLADVLRARPTLVPALSATFGNRRTPSDSEVDRLIETLLRRGVLKPKKD